MSDDRNPGVLLKEIETSRSNLRDYVHNFSIARRRQAAAEIAYERSMSMEMVSLFADYEKDGKRPPGEELRKAVAHAKLDEKVWSDHLTAKADVDALDRLVRVEVACLSSLQSELGQLRDELKHAG